MQVRLTKDDIWNEEDGSRDIILVALETQIFVHTLDLCVADIGTIDMREEVEDSHNGNESDINLRADQYVHCSLHNTTVRRRTNLAKYLLTRISFISGQDFLSLRSFFEMDVCLLLRVINHVCCLIITPLPI
jgi:hypothetical protein